MAPKDQDDWDGSEEESEEYELLADQSQSVFPLRINRQLTAHMVANTLPAAELSAGIEALAKCFYDPNVEWAVLGQTPPGWTLVKEFVNVVLGGAVDKFYRVDIFLRANAEVPEQLFACLFNAMYAMAGFAAVVAQHDEAFEDTHDNELVSLVSATYSLLDARAAIYKQDYVSALPDLTQLTKVATDYIKATAPMELSDGETDEEEQYIHLREVRNGPVWHSYLVQLLVGLGFIEDVVKIISHTKLHSLNTCLRLLDLLWLVVQLRRNICRCPIKDEQKATIHRGVSELLTYVTEETLCDSKAFEKAYGGRDRSCVVLTSVLRTCNEMAEGGIIPNAQIARVQRLLISQLLKSSNFSRLLTAVTECTQLLYFAARRTAVAAAAAEAAAKEAAKLAAAAAEAGMEVEGGAAAEGVELPPDMVGLQEVVAWMDSEGIVKQMLRVNLHQSQYAEAVQALLQLLAKHDCLSDAHLDMLWGVTEQEETFDAVKTNVCGMIKELAQHLRPDQLELLLTKFQFQGRKRALSASGAAGGAAGPGAGGGGGGGRAMTTSDTLRLLDVLKLLAASDTKRASSMARKLTELVWELTTPADAPPELLASGVMLEVLQCYRQHALLTEYISRCIGQLRSRTNVYTALTVLGNLLRLWGKLYGWETQRQRQGTRPQAPRPLPELLSSLDREPPAPQPGAPAPAPPLSRLLVDNLVEFMAGAARWLEERRAEAGSGAGAGAAPSGSGAGPPGGAGAAPQLVPPGQGCYSYQQIVRRYVDTFRLVCRFKDSFVELRLVEALWDGVVLRPNTPEDMPTGLDFIVTCAGSDEEPPQEEGEEEADGGGMPGPLLEFGDLAALLRERVCRLPVENLAQPAFACFKACLHGAKGGLEEHLSTLAAHPNRPARHGVLDEQTTITLLEEVRTLGQDYLWQIVLDCQRADVTAAAFDMLILQVYGRDRMHDMVRDTRQRLMDAAARLTGAPAGTCAWEGVELPAGGEAAAAEPRAGAGADGGGGDAVIQEGADGELGWETAKTRATRCLQLLEKLASKAEETMPPVPAHSCSWQGPPLNLDLNTAEHGRIRLGVSANEYVGLLRRKVAARIGVEPAYVRIMASGQELRPDSREVMDALPASWSAKQPLLVQVSQRPNKFSRFGEEWWAEWHGRSALAVMHHDDQLYRVLLLLADLPRAPAVRAAAGRLLQQLPTCSWVPLALLEALQAGQGQGPAGEQPAAAAALRRLLLGPGVDGDEAGSRSGVVKRPGLLLYTLQALYALMNPNYPPDLLPLVAKPWPPASLPPAPQQQQQPAEGAEDGAAAPQQAQQQPQPPPPLQQAYVAGGAMGDRLMPVLARCLPLLAEVVDRVMGPAAETAAAAVAAAAAGRPANLQPAEGGRDLLYVKDFQWVLVYLLCTIHNRARKGAPADGAAAAVAAGVGSRAHPADSMSSSHGPNDGAAPSSTAFAPDAAAGRGGPRPAGSGGGHDSEAATQEAEAPGVGAHAAATPEVTSADAEAATAGPGAGRGAGSGGALAGAGSSGTAAAAAALVSGLAVSSRNSPDVAAAGRCAGAGHHGAADVDMVGQHERADSAQPQPCPSVSMAGASQPQGPHGPLSMLSPGQAPSVSMAAGGGGGGTGPNTGTGTPACATPHAHGGHGSSTFHGGNGHAAAAAALPGGGSGASASEVAAALVAHYLGAEGLRCLVALLVRLAHDAGRLWGYGPLLRAAQKQMREAAAAGDAGGATASASAAGASASAAALLSAADVAAKLANRALQALGRLINKDELREVFMDDPCAVPMIRETLCCEFSAYIRESALGQLEAVFASPPGGGGAVAAAAGGGGAGLPPGHYMWVLRALVGLRPDMEARLGSCLEFHCLLCKVLHQLSALASAGADARLLADGLLAEEVAALDADATELLAPKRGLLLRGKLMLVQELVRALDRLGLGLGANGRPGLISLLLNRYLFPEAVPLWQQDAGHEAMEAALAHVAVDGGVRRQALALVGALMTGCSANLEAGLHDLTTLHYDCGLRLVDRKFDIGGDGVRSLGPGSYVGLRNGGATCYMNAVLQQLFMQPHIRARVLGAAAVDPEELQDSVFHQLQVIFAHLGLGRAACFHPRGFWNSFKDYDGQPIDVREHQDAYEFFTRLQDTVDSHLRSTGQPAAMQAVMGGKFAAQIICKDVPYRSEREEEFYQISVDVKGFNNLEKSLEGYVAGELMEGDNSYFCEELGARVAAVRRTVIKELPGTLVIHLKRFEYDHYNMTRYKLRDRFEFPLVLDMFKYTADGLAALEGSGGGGGASEDGTGGGGAAAGAGTGGAKRQCYLYDLKGIVVHSGTAFAGHYYSFIKERMRPGPNGQLVDGEWFRFDDRVVSPWSISDLEADCFGGRPSGSTGGGGRADAERPYSAYMLFYERRDSPSVDQPADAMRSVPRDVAAAQQREQQQAAAAVAAAEPPPAVAAAPAAADAMDMDTPPRPAAAAAAAAPAAAALTPYGLPVLLYQSVLRENLALMHKLHVLSPEYCGFVRSVVESVACEASSGLAGGGLAAAGGGSRTKTRRREHLLAAAAAAGSAGGPAPMPLSPAGTPPSGGAAASAATTSAAGGATGGGAESASSAPSQRSEDADEAVLLAARLAAAFLVNIYLPAPIPLRTELPAWRDLARALLSSSPRAAVELLRSIAASPNAQHFYFVRYGSDGAWLADLLTHAVACAARGGAAAAAAAAAAAGGSPPAEDVAASLSGQLQAVAMDLAARLAELAFGPLRDTTRNEPQYVPTCRLLAALAASDAHAASWLIQNHIQPAFTLPGHLLAEAAVSDNDLLPDLAAALELLHALLRYIAFVLPPKLQQQPPGADAGPPTVVRIPPDGAAPHARPLFTLPASQLEELVVNGGVGAAVLAAAAEGGGGGAGGAAGGGAAAVSAAGFTALDAALHSGGLLQVPHALELVRYLLSTGEGLTCRFLNAVHERLAPPDAGSVVLLELVEGLGGAVDVQDGLRVGRAYALLFGTPGAVPGSLVAMAEAAVAKAGSLNWHCMVLAGALASVLGRDLGRAAVRSWPQPAVFSRLEAVVGALMRLMENYVAVEEERQAAQAAAGTTLTAREAAAAAGVAALLERVRRLLASLRGAWEGLRPLLQQQVKEWADARRLQQQLQQQQHQQQQEQQRQQRRHVVAAEAEAEAEEGDGDGGGAEDQELEPGPQQEQDLGADGAQEGDADVDVEDAEAAVGVEPPPPQRGGAGAMERVRGPSIGVPALEDEDDGEEADAVDVDVDVEGGA